VYQAKTPAALVDGAVVPRLVPDPTLSITTIEPAGASMA
jgi:hypothetical protein